MAGRRTGGPEQMSGDRPLRGRADEPNTRPLGIIVEAEAKRVLSEQQLAPDPELVAHGWERRFTTDAKRAAEAIELYRELGYEVLAEPVTPGEMADECEDCQLLMLLQFKAIYTRKKAE